MTNREAVEYLDKYVMNVAPYGKWKEVVELAISALQAQDSPKPKAESVQNVQNEDLITRKAAIDALVKAIRKDPYYDSNEAINGLGVCDVRVILNDLPSAQTERKKGKWIKLDMHAHLAGHKCTACGQECYVPTCMGEPMYTYCPNCGADLRGDEHD